MPSKQIQLNSMYDAVIIGSGPAGAAAARALSGQGLNTLIVEKAGLPRHKMCSGMLGPTSIKVVNDHFGQIPDIILSSPANVAGLKIYPSIKRPILTVPISQFDTGPGLPEIGMSVRRAEFDQWLCVRSKAQIVDRLRLVKVEMNGDDSVLTLVSADHTQKIRARYLVGADGPLSRVRKSLYPGFDNSLRMIPIYEEHYVGSIDLEPEWLHMFYDELVTSFFATVFHKDGAIVVTTGAKQSESVKDYFVEFVKYLKAEHSLVIKEKIREYGCVLHDMSATDNFCLGHGNVLLSGEAGGFNRCAEGIPSALITGKAAGDAILMSLKSGKPALDHYSEMVRPEIEACRKASAAIEEAVGLNPFTR